MTLLYGGVPATGLALDFSDAKIKAVLANIVTCLKTAEARASQNIAEKVSEETATVSHLTDLRMTIALLSAKC